MDLSPRYFLLLILRFALIPLALVSAMAEASTFSYYPGKNSSRHATVESACKSYTSSNYVGEQNPDGSYYCRNTFGNIIYTIRASNVNCPYGHTDLYCNSALPSCSYGAFDPVANSCPAPPACGPDEFQSPYSEACLPKPKCPNNASFDASMNGGEGGCSCTNGTSMVKLDGFSMCMEPLSNDVCTADSPDFAGYINGYAACPGSNRCPSGTKPGFVGAGNTTQAVCYPVTGSQDPSCNGTVGMVGNESVCIPVFGNDPDCPLGSGVINGEKTCIADPNNDPTCPGGVVGYVGSGSEMNKTCIDPSYAPKTCPPGQYIVTKDGSGFGCVTASTKPPADPSAPPKQPQVISGTIKPSTGGTTGGTTGDGGTGTAPCPEGQECNGQDIQIKLPTEGLETTIDGLFEDAPNNTYKDDLDEFGQSELDSVLDPNMHFADVRGQDGLFTERNRLEQFTSFVKTHTVGNSTSCSGNMPFFGMTISCEKFANSNRILGYMLSVLAMFSIYKTLMRPSASGV